MEGDSVGLGLGILVAVACLLMYLVVQYVFYVAQYHQEESCAFS